MEIITKLIAMGNNTAAGVPQAMELFRRLESKLLEIVIFAQEIMHHGLQLLALIKIHSLVTINLYQGEYDRSKRCTTKSYL